MAKAFGVLQWRRPSAYSMANAFGVSLFMFVLTQFFSECSQLLCQSRQFLRTHDDLVQILHGGDEGAVEGRIPEWKDQARLVFSKRTLGQRQQFAKTIT